MPDTLPSAPSCSPGTMCRRRQGRELAAALPAVGEAVLRWLRRQLARIAVLPQSSEVTQRAIAAVVSFARLACDLLRPLQSSSDVSSSDGQPTVQIPNHALLLASFSGRTLISTKGAVSAAPVFFCGHGLPVMVEISSFLAVPEHLERRSDCRWRAQHRMTRRRRATNQQPVGRRRGAPYQPVAEACAPDMNTFLSISRSIGFCKTGTLRNRASTLSAS